MADKMPHDISVSGLDVRAFTDDLRSKHPIVKNINNEWVLLKHADVMAAALDDERFSSKVSRYLQIPNGLDGEEHTQYRAIIDRYLSKQALTPFISVFENVAAQLMSELPKGQTLDAVNDIGAVLAVRLQCEWLGWPKELEAVLLEWMDDNHIATRSGKHDLTAQVAEKFDVIIRSVVQPRRADNNNTFDDVTSKLCAETINGRLLTEEELVSILRNWTGGDLGSIALCIGVIVAYIVEHPQLIEEIRQGSDSKVDAIIDEILRIDDPFVSNRRVTTCPMHVAGQDIPAGAKVKLNWTSANRDEGVFDQNQFDPEGNADKNLVYGIGKHVCPGRLLSTWELRIAIKALLNSVQNISFTEQDVSEREVSPVGGYHRVPVVLA
ncbi:cytochrome [Vibrio sp. UCD-FRSSP16_10]|uniref:cytochrome P450 n=1 Tax=unclassified Vibrio TaxID=2614977 RepID=UPI000800EF2B|nr:MULTISPECIES: cytochrome P450 [unclassified Vibrio]OBT13850.1 cytochrome [Vibrio sp. UCD-FRSSP16_30]OBT22731.1 cytochrome [Vibrio sp. UCD-FRSSP16_10]